MAAGHYLQTPAGVACIPAWWTAAVDRERERLAAGVPGPEMGVLDTVGWSVAPDHGQIQLAHACGWREASDHALSLRALLDDAMAHQLAGCGPVEWVSASFPVSRPL